MRIRSQGVDGFDTTQIPLSLLAEAVAGIAYFDAGLDKNGGTVVVLAYAKRLQEDGDPLGDVHVRTEGAVASDGAKSKILALVKRSGPNPATCGLGSHLAVTVGEARSATMRAANRPAAEAALAKSREILS